MLPSLLPRRSLSPDDGLKLSDLARLIVSRHPNTGIDRVLEGTRWSVDGEMVYADLDAFVLRGGEEVALSLPCLGDELVFPLADPVCFASEGRHQKKGQKQASGSDATPNFHMSSSTLPFTYSPSPTLVIGPRA
jgi:hypothetical protein